MIEFDDVINENIKEHNPNWLEIHLYTMFIHTDHPYIILIIWGSGSGKTNSLFNLRIHQPDIYKMYWHADPYKAILN